MTELWSAVRMLVAEMLLHLAARVAPANQHGRPLLEAIVRYFTEHTR